VGSSYYHPSQRIQLPGSDFNKSSEDREELEPQKLMRHDPGMSGNHASRSKTLREPCGRDLQSRARERALPPHRAEKLQKRKKQEVVGGETDKKICIRRGAHRLHCNP